MTVSISVGSPIRTLVFEKKLNGDFDGELSLLTEMGNMTAFDIEHNGKLLYSISVKPFNHVEPLNIDGTCITQSDKKKLKKLKNGTIKIYMWGGSGGFVTFTKTREEMTKYMLKGGYYD